MSTGRGPLPPKSRRAGRVSTPSASSRSSSCWEDTLPGYGRPQGIIKKDVERCDLFIGLLWSRWGSQTGSYSSGFEEEFELARERRRSAGSPEIWLCFKKIDPDQVNDPGEQREVCPASQMSVGSFPSAPSHCSRVAISQGCQSAAHAAPLPSPSINKGV